MNRRVLVVTALLVYLACTLPVFGVSLFTVEGGIESRSGGFTFPDGSVQLSAALPPCVPITDIPTTILESGVYCLTDDLATSITTGNAITLEANNITIDLNGWTLDGSGAGTATEATGIYGYQLNNITIRNGTIQGFHYGVHLDVDSDNYFASLGNLIERIRASANTGAAFFTNGVGNVIRHNHIVNTGNSTISANYNAYGVASYGTNCEVMYNTINNTAASNNGTAKAIYLMNAGYSIIEGNQISGLYSGLLNMYGIYLVSSHDVIVRGNSISSSYWGVFFDTEASGKYMDNLTEVQTAYTGGTPVGTND
jgi:parallel beta-helix repeat protein